MSIMSALEKLETATGDPAADQNVDELGEVMLAVMEEEQEVADETDSLEEMEETVDEVEEAVERLESLAGTITKYGISKPMMMAADPKCELVSKGIVGSYEELEDTPVKDDNADAAVEGIKETVKMIWEKLKAFFTKIWNTLKGWIVKAMNLFKNYEKALAVLVKKIEEIEVDEKKLGDIKVNGVSKTDLTAAISALEKVSSTKAFMEAETQASTLAAIAGGKEGNVDEAVNAGSEALTTLSEELPKLERKSGTLKGFGWKKADAVAVAKAALKLLNDLGKAKRSFEVAVKVQGDSAKTLNQQTRYIDKLENEDLKKRNSAITGLKKVAAAQRNAMQKTIVEAQKVAQIALSVGKAVIKAKK